MAERVLDDVIARIVDVAAPEKIILFGSAARGETGRNSDLDLLIIKDGADGLDLMARIYKRLHGVGAAVDAIVVSPPRRGTLQGQPRAGHQARFTRGHGGV